MILTKVRLESNIQSKFQLDKMLKSQKFKKAKESMSQIESKAQIESTFNSPDDQKQEINNADRNQENSNSDQSISKQTIFDSPAKKYQKISKFDKGFNDRIKEPLKMNQIIINTDQNAGCLIQSSIYS